MSQASRRWLVAGGAALAASGLLAAFVLYTDVGVPAERYTAVPDPCELLHEPTVRELAGDVPLSQIADTGPGRARWGLTPDTERKGCFGPGTEVTRGSAHLSVLRLSGTQLRLGPTGEEQAANLLLTENESLRATYPRGCVHEVSSERGDACGMHHEERLFLHLQRDNLYVGITVELRDPPQDRSDADLKVLLATLTEEVVSKLDDAP